jgi:hypothetical protein
MPTKAVTKTQVSLADGHRAVGDVFPDEPSSRERYIPLIEAAQRYIRKLIEQALCARKPDMPYPFHWAEKLEEYMLYRVTWGGFQNCDVSAPDIVDLVEREVWVAIDNELGPLDVPAKQEALEAKVRAFMERTDY